MTTAAPPPAYVFDREQLGDTLPAWKARSPRTAAAVCTPDAANPGAVACVTADAPLGGKYLVRAPRYRFVDGRLARIAFTTSIDAFAYADAVLSRAYDAPAKVVFGQTRFGSGELASEVRTWKGPRTTARLVDPDARPDRLSVTVSLSPPAPAT